MRAGDICQKALGFVCCLLALPLIAIIGLIVLCTLGRPILFVQERAGIGGAPFRLIKFRTMTQDRGSDGRLLPDEARTTQAGRLLRRSRLDELPELLNIARGEMAFVGPRPLLPETIAAMGTRGGKRGTVLPGLTGWSQVNGNTRLSNAQKLDLDLWYIANRSLLLDIRIAWMTLGVLVGGEKLTATSAPGGPG